MTAGNAHEKGRGDGQPPKASGKTAPQLDARIQDAIGRSLQAHYDDLLKEPVPDRFLALLAELEAKEQRSGK
jgi:hypothetical protein